MPVNATKQCASRQGKSRYAETLLLPKTGFALRPDHAANRLRYLDRITNGLYHWQQKSLPEDKTFVLHDGPPFSNGSLHLGHALNKVLKDVVLRSNIANGRRVDFVPGWDCHGLPTEVKALQAVSKHFEHTAPQTIRTLAKDFAHDAIGRQIQEFRSFGVAADYENYWATMHPAFELQQLRIFQLLAEKGCVYRQYKPVYWSASSMTALAEGELEYNDQHKSTAVFVKFPLLSSKDCFANTSLLVWTTTPWTILANRAIAVNHALDYSIVQSNLHGLLVVATSRLAELARVIEFQIVASISPTTLTSLRYQHPLIEDSSYPILHAPFVDENSGTGVVHCAPGHGMDDYKLCQAHNIAPFSPVDDTGCFTQDALDGSYIGLRVLSEGQQRVIDQLDLHSALVSAEEYKHRYPYDWRTDLPVIVRATAQWFVDVGKIKGPAIASLDGVCFTPSSGRSRLASFISSRTEWCLSRQRAWGAPLPILYDDGGSPILEKESIAHIISCMAQRGSDAWWEDDLEPWVAPKYKGIAKRKGRDTMDVWFDSGTSWGLIEKRFGKRQPLIDLCIEGSDQHRGWFQSSLLTYLLTNNGQQAPYKSVITHGFILDHKGRKMSKSLGNVINPSDVIQGSDLCSPIGIDGLRLWVAQNEYSRDMVIGKSVLDHVEERLRKIRSTIRFILANLSDWNGCLVPYDELSKLDKLLLHQLFDFNIAVKQAYEDVTFSKVVNAINHATTSTLSSFYLDIIKDTLYADAFDSPQRRAVQTVLFNILQNLLQAIQPILPMLCEEAWEYAPQKCKQGSPWACQMQWQHPDHQWRHADLASDWRSLMEVRAAALASLEKARKAKIIKSSLEAALHFHCPSTDKFFQKYKDELSQLLIVSETRLVDNPTLNEFTEKFSIDGCEYVVQVHQAQRAKCPRCWQYRSTTTDELCSRCVQVLSG